MAGVYTFLVTDLLTNAVLAELPLDGCSFERRLNGAGTFSGSLPLGDPGLAKIDPIGATQPGRTALYVDRDGVLEWGGIIWTRSWDSNQRTLTLNGSEFWSYFQRRNIRADKKYTNVDMFTIVEGLINYAQTPANGNIGVVVPSSTCGVLQTVAHLAYQRDPLGRAVEDLAALDNGFDFAIDVAYASGVPTKTLNLSYPRRGVIASTSGLIWELPGNMLADTWPEDATASSNVLDCLGAGSGPQILIGTASDAGSLTAGYPQLDGTISAKDGTVRANLNAMARAEVAVTAFPVVLPSITVRAGDDPVVGSYTVGDECRLRISDERFPETNGVAGIDASYRIMSYVLRPGSTQDQENVVLTLGPTV